MRIKSAVAFGLILIILFLSVCSFAEIPKDKWHGEKDHNEWTNEVLFGQESYKSSKPISIRTAIRQLDDAVLLCIDQFNGSYKDKLDKLNEDGVPGIPKNISKIDFQSNSSHRMYTHLGWNYNYKTTKGNPEVRKKLLFSVVDYVFNFKKYMSRKQAEKVCNAMCCLLYISHILGDRYHSKAYYGAAGTLLLAADSYTDSVIHDLLNCLPDLFPLQSKNGSSVYLALVRKLNEYSRTIIKENRMKPHKEELLVTDEEYSVIIKDHLKEYIPKLLDQQDWFVSVFPVKWKYQNNISL